MRLLVTGDREWRNPVRIRECLASVIMSFDEDEWHVTLVEGEARGADTEARIVWQLFYPTWEYDPFPADWNAYGPAAGPIRNKEMLESGVDYVIGFHNDIVNSKGTKDMLKQCAKAGIPGRLFTEEGEVENWQSLVSFSKSRD